VVYLKLVDSYLFLERLRNLIYSLLELRDGAKETGYGVVESTPLTKYGFISMFKGGVIMDATNPEQARVAEEAGAVGGNGSRQATLRRQDGWWCSENCGFEGHSERYGGYHDTCVC
jgi:hypothetical protein